MRIGVPKEIKSQEYRVGLTPRAVAELVRAGHAVDVERGAGTGAGYADDDYARVGAALCESPQGVYGNAELIVKVKEPQPAELPLLRRGQLLFSYLHLAAEPELADALAKSGVTALAYETVSAPGHGLPLLAPMSRIAGRMSVQVGAHYLEKPAGGAGLLLGGVPGVSPARVVVVGGGVAGTNAVEMAVGLQANVTVIDNDVEKLERLAARFENRIETVYSTHEAIAASVAGANLVIGTVLVPGRSAPKLVTRAMLATLPPGSVAVDVAIDQGGSFETSRPTSHADPVFSVDGVLHYCVTNIPGAVPRTSTQALVHATLPYVRALADQGWPRALERYSQLAGGLNVEGGEIRHPGIAADLARLREARGLAG
jgi:alanine dehydrogenase